MFQVTITIQSSKIPEEDELKNLAIKELAKKRINIKKSDISAFVFRKKYTITYSGNGGSTPISSATGYAHIAHRWIEFAKDLIRKDDERRQKELEERLIRRTADMMASKYGVYGTYASNDMWYDLNYYRPSPSIFNNLSNLDCFWLEPENNSNL